MKKALLGCGVAFVVLAVLGGGAFYFFLYKPFMSDYVGGAVQLAEVAQLNEEVRDQSPYAPPASGELTETQVARFVHVQQAMRETMGQRFGELEQKCEALDQELNRESREASYREMLGAWRDLSDLIVEAKRAQVEALNAQDFSVEEYQWVRTAVYQAAGTALPSASLGEMVQAAQESGQAENGQADPEAWRQQLDRVVPEKNRRLTAPHAEALKENAGLAWFGL